MNRHHALNYLELPAVDMAATRQFFEAVFAWRFQDHGSNYQAFQDGQLEGGFYRVSTPLCSRSESGAALPIFYSADLEASRAAVLAAGGQVLRDIFAFPGGWRFHFTEPSGNEFAVWSERAPA